MSERGVSSSESYIEANLRRNTAVQLAHGMFGQTGFRLFNAPTFLPVYLFTISGSEVFVGVARALQALGQVVTPVLGASLIGHRSHMLRITLVAGVLMRLQILFVALSGLLLSGSALPVAVVFFMTLMGAFQGIQGVMMNSLRAKVIPVRRRGFVTGWRNFLAGGTTAAVSYFAGGYFIDHDVLGNGYASLFLLAFCITSFGLVALALTREPAATDVRRKESVRQSFAALAPMLKENLPFARFFVASVMGSFGRMAMPFYILYAGTLVELSGAMLAVLTTIWMLTGTASNLVWGNIADRHGYRVVMMLTLGLWSAAHIELLFADSIGSVMIFFTVVGMAVGGFNQARQNMVLELGAAADVPLRVALSNMSVNAIGTIGPLAGGVIAALFDYSLIIALALAMQGMALVIVCFFVDEPREQAG